MLSAVRERIVARVNTGARRDRDQAITPDRVF